jgi:pimeloyl-ACP methyl ester carboxylesterase
MSTHRAAVVIVSGGDAISPFTTPAHACGAGLAAGSTDTGLREALLTAGLAVYTSPANAGPGVVTTDPGFGGFSEPPPQPPASMTVNSVGPIDGAGEHLAAFLVHLAAEQILTAIHLVGHSMGGLFARAAIRELVATGSALSIRSLTTIGTPWEGSFAADYAGGDMPLSAAGGDRATETIMTEFTKIRDESSSGAGEQVTHRYLAGPGGWNERQAGVLDGIPVTLIGGDHFHREEGAPQTWPHDGLVTLHSALATAVPSSVLPHRRTQAFPDVHSIYFADVLGLDWQRALTWDPAVLAVVVNAITTPTLPMRPT